MKRSIRSLVIFVCVLAVVGQAQAITVGWDATAAALADFDAGGPSTDPANQGDLIMIGSFNFNADFNLNNQAIMTAAAAGDFSTLNANFTPFATGAVGTGFNLDGIWSISSTAPSGTVGGKSIYLWTFNAASTGGASQWGIYTATGSNWRFPSDQDPVPSTVVDLGDVNVILAGQLGGIIDYGTFQVPMSFEMVPIPEPSTLVLVGLGIGSLALIRRRRKV